MLISTNEVFDGRRDDGRGYVESGPAGADQPIRRQQAAWRGGRGSRVSGERRSDSLWIVRTSWLFGPPGNDFPSKILAAADRLSAGEPLTVVADEHASPTYTIDLAPALLDLVDAAPGGIYHLAAPGAASRFDVALEIVRACRPGIELEPIGRAAFARESTPPAFSALDSSRARRLRGCASAVARCAVGISRPASAEGSRAERGYDRGRAEPCNDLFLGPTRVGH